MSPYCEIDLHSTNSYVVVLDDEDRIVLDKRLPASSGSETCGRAE